ncbi:MAG: hypothetical protein A2X61_11220 [Ignavibacteria bacterium GWB2_35_12]|nr:MAG: hypothetical protein A2X61_11220 [Ignavibacteria bacterium GWB2_35_12]OGU89749.1 MAG: hypothetical protein A2220_02785 [Ignavibacteria bacterium RIFOXYA2_FULL_35_10]OGV24006.1 MAG: hypothetical protein A2475_10865 [Ignavibacteria bacterium RIFOXYC2_FULL_35_21]
MAIFRPFKAFRPLPQYAQEVAAKPYDVLNSNEAKEEVKGHPLSFLHVGKPEIDLDPNINHYDPQVYEKGKENLMKLINDGILKEDEAPFFYVYAQTMDGRTQYGLVGCASVDDYWNDVIKKHEKTRKDKEDDRSNHVRITNSHSGPIFLTYRDNDEINKIVTQITNEAPEINLVALDGIRHQCWVIRDKDKIEKIRNTLANVPNFYVADGHHRSAAAGIVGRERQKANPNHKGDEEYNFFLTVLFPASHLYIMDYNRVIKDLNGLTKEEFFEKLEKHFTITESNSRFKPAKKGEIGMYIDGKWFQLNINANLLRNPDPVESLDVAILQKYVNDEILGIDDPRTSKRIDFVGGIRGLEELERRVNSGEMKLAFAMYPTSVNELMKIADAGKIMPPKSTWFEPKLRDGLFVHFLD